MTDSERLDFIIENQLRIERWHRIPLQEFFTVTTRSDETLAECETGREAIDAAMTQVQEA